jgi:hypothetical protein
MEAEATRQPATQESPPGALHRRWSLTGVSNGKEPMFGV